MAGVNNNSLNSAVGRSALWAKLRAKVRARHYYVGRTFNKALMDLSRFRLSIWVRGRKPRIVRFT